MNEKELENVVDVTLVKFFQNAFNTTAQETVDTSKVMDYQKSVMSDKGITKFITRFVEGVSDLISGCSKGMLAISSLDTTDTGKKMKLTELPFIDLISSHLKYIGLDMQILTIPGDSDVINVRKSDGEDLKKFGYEETEKGVSLSFQNAENNLASITFQKMKINFLCSYYQQMAVSGDTKATERITALMTLVAGEIQKDIVASQKEFGYDKLETVAKHVIPYKGEEYSKGFKDLFLSKNDQEIGDEIASILDNIGNRDKGQ